MSTEGVSLQGYGFFPWLLRCLCFIYTVRKARMEGELRIVVKWSGKEYDILDIQEEDTVLTLKERIHRETGVRPERQKLLNLKFKGYILRIF